MRRDNNSDCKGEKAESDEGEEYAPDDTQLTFGLLGDFGDAFRVVDAHCKLQRDPVMDDAYAELCSLYNPVYVVDDRVERPVPD